MNPAQIERQPAPQIWTTDIGALEELVTMTK